jgi:hypothetical protein
MSTIGRVLVDMHKSDPQNVKIIFRWYSANYNFIKPITNFNKEYREFVNAFREMCYTNKIHIGDGDTTMYFLYASYTTMNQEIVNITIAYIYLDLYQNGKANGVVMTREVYLDYFKKSLSIFKKAMVTFEKELNKDHD